MFNEVGRLKSEDLSTKLKSRNNCVSIYCCWPIFPKVKSPWNFTITRQKVRNGMTLVRF